jgi:hypothetical protein
MEWITSVLSYDKLLCEVLNLKLLTKSWVLFCKVIGEVSTKYFSSLVQGLPWTIDNYSGRKEITFFVPLKLNYLGPTLDPILNQFFPVHSFTAYADTHSKFEMNIFK